MSWVTPAEEAGQRSRPAARAEKSVQVRRSVLPAYEDPAFAALAGCRLGSAGFVHLRWATSGLAVAEENTHPFLLGGWAFAHQGSIPTPERLEALLGPEWLARRRGTTDSEAYFLHLLQCVQQEANLVRGIRRAVSEIAGTCGPASLNALLLSPSSLVVVHNSAGLEPPRDDLLATVARPEDLPVDHLEGYFGLRYRRREDGIVVTSSGLAAEGWTEIPADSIFQVDLSTGSLTLHSFDGAASVGTSAGSLRSSAASAGSVM
jgi:predicted glutamine amidotransferase